VNILIRSTLRKRRRELSAVPVRLERLLAAAGQWNAEVSVLFVGDGAMRTLNRRYRKRDRTTDVLSFSFREGGGMPVRPAMLGDIVIAVPVAERQAREDGETLTRSLDRLLVHGLLHLLGYDHERSAAEARRMQARERKLLGVLGR
jgi:rRNA maturation RNase YbeY